MNHENREDFVTRDAIMRLLSDAEVARVCIAESAPGLSEGDEYIDLEDLGRGVRRAAGEVLAMGSILPRKAVLEDTWTLIVNQLRVPRLARAVTAS